MNKVYKSAVAKWYVALCVAMTIVFVLSILFCLDTGWVLLIDVVFMGGCVLLLYDMLLHTDYTISGDKLRIRCGVLFRMDLPVSKISEISYNSTILSSPALSARRICLKYGRTNRVYISPKNRDEFIADMLALNNKIKIKG